MYSVRILGLLILLLALLAPQVSGRKEDKPKMESKAANIRNIKINFVPFLTGGFVIGETARKIEDYGGAGTDKLLYGFGASLCYLPRPRFTVAVNLEYAYKELPGADIGTGRGWFYSGSFIYNLRTFAKRIPYLRFDAGMVSGKWPRSGPDLKVGTHPYVRMGIGVFSFTAGSTNTRVEAYYIHAFSEGYEIEQLSDYEVDFNAQCLGVEFGVGFPMSSR
ncbi:MAG: hypothetical protein JSW34_03910 [Candidatus Zixiibacteriota bacterium]|nr:MAG: hypothetical protein JSW34_03910 [candidate division Zixibacteria bacterium]